MRESSVSKDWLEKCEKCSRRQKVGFSFRVCQAQDMQPLRRVRRAGCIQLISPALKTDVHAVGKIQSRINLSLISILIIETAGYHYDFVS